MKDYEDMFADEEEQEDEYGGDEKRSEGDRRKTHSQICKDRLARLYKVIQRDICGATKPTKTKQVMIWSVVLLMFGSYGVGSWWSVSSANDLLDKVNDKAVVDAQQDGRINSLETIVAEHHEVQMGALDDAMDGQTAIILEQKALTKKMHHLEIMQMRALTILEKIDE